MDWLNKPYTVYANLYDDPAMPAVRITWYKCQPGAKRFPGSHAYGCMDWESDTREYPTTTPGERDLIHFKRPAAFPIDNGQGPIPTPLAWFKNGVPASFIPLSACGRPFPRGIGERGGPGVWGWFVDWKEWRNIGPRERGAPGGVGTDYMRAACELAGPDGLVAGFAAELAGPGVEFIPMRDGVKELAGPDGLYADRMSGVAELAGPDGLVAGFAAELAGPDGLVAGFAAELAGPDGMLMVGVGEIASGCAWIPIAGTVGLYNTGVWDEGPPQRLTCPDELHWTMNGSAPKCPLVGASEWVPNAGSCLSRWLAPGCVDSHPLPIPGTYTYALTFEVETGTLLPGMVLRGREGADDQVSACRINGTTTGYTSSTSWINWSTFNLDASLLIEGTNTIEFDVVDSVGVNWTGFRCEFIALLVP